MTPPTPSSLCPFHRPTSTKDWWPNQLDVSVLKKHENPFESDYPQRFLRLNLKAVENDLHLLMTSTQPWWPSDYGHYGPLFIRLAWHSAGTYRTIDGHGGGGLGQIRFAPLNSWPDNANLDKGRRLLWPIKQKYDISWADLMILAGNVALKSMGLEPLGFGGGRIDVEWPQDEVNWGFERKWLTDTHRYPDNQARESLEKPLGAVQMGLIYVNPQGPEGVPDPLLSARDIRETFKRMAMDDEETVALIAGGHTFGKCHGSDTKVGTEPEGTPLQNQGLGWRGGNAQTTNTSGLEGAWTANPIRWDNGYFEVLLKHEWDLTKSPTGALQWTPKNYRGPLVPDAHFKNIPLFHKPIMLTSDLALKMDPKYCAISQRFHQDPQAFAKAFQHAWYKLTHRDLGLTAIGPQLPPLQLWQDPIPSNPFPTPRQTQLAAVKKLLLQHLTSTELVSLAWASACTFRYTDKRGGANGARIRLSPQKDWQCNRSLKPILKALEGLLPSTNMTMADLIVWGGCVGIEEAGGGKIGFTPGRGDATTAETDVESFAVLEPQSDGFRDFASNRDKAEFDLVAMADRLSLTAREMTVLVGGFRALGIGQGGFLTRRVGQLTNDFFINLLDNALEWQPVGKRYQAVHCETKQIIWSNVSRVDLVFGSNSILRGIAENYAVANSQERFVRDFGHAFVKVMDLDRFDLQQQHLLSKVTSKL